MASRANTTPTTAVTYLRLSTETAEGQGDLTLARQRAAVSKLAKSLDLRIVGEYAEVRSAWSGKKRPEYQRLLADIRAGQVETVLVWATDRLIRKTSDLVGLIDVLMAADVPVFAVTGSRLDLSTSEGRLNARMLGALAEFESDRKSERQIAKNEQRAVVELKNWHGGVTPMGWRAVVGAAGLEPDPETGPVVADLYRRVAAGESIASLVKWLNAEGYRGPRGAAYTSTSVRVLLSSPRHAGLVIRKGQIVGEAADRQRLIEPDLYYEVMAIFNDPERVNLGMARGTTLLAGLVRCPCGSKCSSSNKQQRNADGVIWVPVYRCRACGRTRRKALVDPGVLAAIQTYMNLHAAALAQAPARPDAKRTTAVNKVARLERDLEQLASALAAGDLDVASYTAATKRLRADLEVARASLVRHDRPALVALGPDTPGDRWAVIAETDPQAARPVVLELVEAVQLLDPEEGRGRRPLATDLEIVWRP